MSAMDKGIPSWVYKWLVIVMVIGFYDGLFCVLRPYSLPGGCLEMIFYGHKYYIQWDTHYADTSDSFIWTQGLGNIIEALIILGILLNQIKTIRLQKMLIIVVSVMTAWKTVMFMIYSLDIGLGGHSFDLVAEIVVFVPALPWLFVPTYIAWLLTNDFLPQSSKKYLNDTVSSRNDLDSPDASLRRRHYNLRNSKK
ncbi:hypothetical protein MAR_022235 [Mya arenaria]|uniref:Emopamil-binding protein n=1 Tax=Mya arenaria TaxID=6604 RepID=A0ABY7DMB3_MYAAR|nr:uncharacterized protein LOC128229125 [Mya arenaria]WAQ97862.1 hypothetical protein MAR_022235 [Mya arenaria]